MTYDIVLFTGVERPQVFATSKPYGAYKCARELRKNGYSVVVINFAFSFNDQNLKRIIDSAVGKNTLFVGFSNSFMNNFIQHKIKFISDLAQEKHPGVKIVLGGASTSADTYLKPADFVVIGYADRSIVNIANHLKHREPLNFSYKHAIGHQLIRDWAKDHDMENDYFEWHDDDIIMPQERNLPLEVSRGCIFDCKFCNFPLKGKQMGNYIKRIENLKRELLHNYEKFGVTHYRILDDTFNDNREKLTRMQQMVKELPFRPKFWAYIRLDLLDKHPETIEQMADIGVSFMVFGIETLHRPTGKIIGKGYDPEKLVARIKDIKQRYGNRMILFGNFIAGLPGESVESILETQRRLESGEIGLDSWKYQPLGIARDSGREWMAAFGLDLKKYGYTDNGDGYWNMKISASSRRIVNWSNDYMTFEDAKRLSYPRDYADYGSWEFLNLGMSIEQISTYLARYTKQNNLDARLEKLYRNFVKSYQEQALKHVTGETVTVALEDLVNLDQDYL